jgi:hypothetical protein
MSNTSASPHSLIPGPERHHITQKYPNNKPCRPTLLTTMPTCPLVLSYPSDLVNRVDLIPLTLLARALAKERPTAPVQARAHRDWTRQDAHGDVPERASTSPALVDIDHLLPSPLTCSLTSTSASPWTSPLARRCPVAVTVDDDRPPVPLPVHDVASMLRAPFSAR